MEECYGNNWQAARSRRAVVREGEGRWLLRVSGISAEGRAREEIGEGTGRCAGGKGRVWRDEGWRREMCKWAWEMSGKT